MVAGHGAQQQTSAQLLAETEKLRSALDDARRGHESERLSRAHVEATCQQLQSQLHSVHKAMPSGGRVPTRTYQSDLDAHALAFSVDLMNLASRSGTAVIAEPETIFLWELTETYNRTTTAAPGTRVDF